MRNSCRCLTVTTIPTPAQHSTAQQRQTLGNNVRHWTAACSLETRNLRETPRLNGSLSSKLNRMSCCLLQPTNSADCEKRPLFHKERKKSGRQKIKLPKGNRKYEAKGEEKGKKKKRMHVVRFYRF